MNTESEILIDRPKVENVTLGRYLDPTNDVAFKRIFENKPRLIDFLNGVLADKLGSKIVSISPLSIEDLPNTKEGKRSLVDVKVEDEQGKKYVIEMQRCRDPFFESRIQCYGSHTLISGLRKGDETFETVTPVIMVSILSHNLFDASVPYISFHKNTEDSTSKCHLHLLRYAFIELGKFNTPKNECKTVTDQWLFFLKHWSELKAPPANTTDKFVLEAYEEIERFNWTAQQYDAYFSTEMAISQEYGRMKKAKEEARAEGIAEGIAEGVVEGDTARKLKVARKLIAEGKDVQYISALTELTEDEVNRLCNKEKGRNSL